MASASDRVALRAWPLLGLSSIAQATYESQIDIRRTRLARQLMNLHITSVLRTAEAWLVPNYVNVNGDTKFAAEAPIAYEAALPSRHGANPCCSRCMPRARSAG